MRRTAVALVLEISPLQDEWWDFRMNKSAFEKHDPLYESDLAPHQRLLKPKTSTVKNILNGFYPKDMAQTLSDIQSKVNQLWETSLCDESCVLSFEARTQQIAEQDLKQNAS